MTQAALIESTEMLDFQGEAITSLLESKAWMNPSECERIGAAYDYVRNDISFGYNASDDLTASEVLADAYGQCNTKGTPHMGQICRE